MNLAGGLVGHETALLWHAMEGTNLVELRNGADDLPAASVEEHRRKVLHMLAQLVDTGSCR